jgi:hypothetical protein
MNAIALLANRCEPQACRRTPAGSHRRQLFEIVKKNAHRARRALITGSQIGHMRAGIPLFSLWTTG